MITQERALALAAAALGDCGRVAHHCCGKEFVQELREARDLVLRMRDECGAVGIVHRGTEPGKAGEPRMDTNEHK